MDGDCFGQVSFKYFFFRIDVLDLSAGGLFVDSQ